MSAAVGRIRPKPIYNSSLWTYTGVHNSTCKIFITTCVITDGNSTTKTV
jgi:hypothetical protein